MRSRSRRLSPSASLGMLLLLAAGCASSKPAVTATAASRLSEETITSVANRLLDWSDVGGGIDEATLTVPLDYANPSAGTIDLNVVRHRAKDDAQRIGSLLVNPGGPGFGGSFLAQQASAIYGDRILDRFDIIGWDPRGTGESTPAVNCIDEYDPYFGVDISPETPADLAALVALGKQIADACAAANPELLAHISTLDSARDMDAIRQALGEDKISYFGFSYGSELGATWATMFPATVRAAVLDGAVDPNQPSVEAVLAQATGFERALESFLAQCSDDTECPFHNDGDAQGAFDRLMVTIEETPIPTTADRTAITNGVALTAVAQAMYSESFWPTLEQALADAQSGDGAMLLTLYDEYYQRNPDGTYGDELEAFFAIECLDDPGPLTVEEVESHRAEYIAAAPRFGESFISSYTCVNWPVPPVPDLVITGAGAGPIVVVGTTGDPATPLSSTEAMASALEGGALVVVEADQHTGYGLNSCINDAVESYLVDLAVPADGLRC